MSFRRISYASSTLRSGSTSVPPPISSIKAGEILDLAVELGIVKKSGAWFSCSGSKLGQGRDAVKNVIRENKELAGELKKLIVEKMEAIRKEKGGKGNPFLPSKDSKRSDLVDDNTTRDDDDDDGDAEDPGEGRDGSGDDLFGDDFDVQTDE